MNKKLILTGFAIFISLIFLMAPIGAASHSISPAATTSTNYQPNPSLNVQATWSSYNSSMAYNEYVNSTGQPEYLNVENGTGNYISIDPEDIVSKGYLQQEKLGGYEPWNESTTAGLSTTNISYTVNPITENGVQILGIEANVIGTNGGWASGNTMQIPISDYASSNLAYDYLTMIISANLTGGADSNIQVYNSTGTSIAITPIITTGEAYITISMQEIEDKYGIGLNDTAGKGYSSYFGIQDRITLPSGAAVGKYYSQIDTLSLTTYPITFGSNATGTIITQKTGNIHLANFKPAVPMEILNNGYSENLTQLMSLTNYTTTQTPITSGNYIEQVGYQATFGLPSAPDLSYGAANFTLPLSVPADQFQALDVNGVSYLNEIGNKTNGTVVLLSSVDATSSISYLAYVDFTPSQWQSISHPAGIFTIAGIEYYWFIAVGAIAGLLGLAGGVRHAHNKAEQTEKINRGGR